MIGAESGDLPGAAKAFSLGIREHVRMEKRVLSFFIMPRVNQPWRGACVFRGGLLPK